VPVPETSTSLRAAPLVESAFEPRFVGVEKCDDGLSHRFGERRVFGGEHAAEAQTAAAQYLEVKAEVGVEPADRVDP
jgi:hypothetical protein